MEEINVSHGDIFTVGEKPEKSENNVSIAKSAAEKQLEGIKRILTENNLNSLKEKGFTDEIIKELEACRENIKITVALLEQKGIEDGHPFDRIGNFDASIVGLIRRILSGKNIEKTGFIKEINQYHGYFHDCVNEPGFLEKDIESRDGVKEEDAEKDQSKILH